MHLAGFLLTLNYDARNHEFNNCNASWNSRIFTNYFKLFLIFNCPLCLPVPHKNPNSKVYQINFMRYATMKCVPESEKQDIQCTYKCNIKTRSRNFCCRGIAIGITYSECVSVALCIQHTQCMRRILLSPVDCLLYHIFPHYHIKGMKFLKILFNISKERRNSLMMIWL